MSESGATKGTKTLKVQLTAGAFEKDFDTSLVDAIKAFAPLSFAAGEDAISWLRRYIEAPEEIPLLTVLDLDPKTNELLGFCVLGYIQFSFESTPEKPEIGADIAWIARSTNTESGFGEELFEYAVSVALDEDAAAMVVTPHDEETATKVWVERFHFEWPSDEDQPDGAPPRLYLPIRDP